MSNSLASLRRLVRSGLKVVSPVLFVALGLAAGCSSSGSSGGSDSSASPSVSLDYRPTDSNPATGRLMSSKTIYLAPVDDQRADKSSVGLSSEDGTSLPVRSTGKSVADFVRDGFTRSLTGSGAKVVQDESSAELTLGVTLNSFQVTESGSYQALVEANVTLRGRDGATVWQGPATATDGTFGKTRSNENYQQVLSNATMKAAASLASDPAFVKALK